MTIRTRYAPSPTGNPHLGNLRTAVFSYLVAKASGGQFILRVEDTDQARKVEGSIEYILESLEWLGISPDEGVVLRDGKLTEVGEYGPYTQSERLALYSEKADELVASGSAYRCFCSAERLDEMRKEQQKNHQAPRYDRCCRGIEAEESAVRAESESFVIRHAIPDDRTVSFTDIIRGEISFQSNDLDDYVLMKSDGFPTYQLANVVDDNLMKITHVLRGEEWIPSTPKNLLLYEAFGFEAPHYAHLPLILGPDKAKLSKRHGAEPILTYRDQGYLPEAILNVLAFLGWSPGTEEEFFTKEQLIERFQLEKVQKGAAIFNQERLEYVNGWYIRHLPVEEVAEKMLPYLQEAGLASELNDFVMKVATTVQERLKYFNETVEVSQFFFQRPEVNLELIQLMIPKKSSQEELKTVFLQVSQYLEGLEDWTVEVLEEKLRSFITEHQLKPMQVLWPIRACLTGVPASPGTFEMLAILGKEESLARMEAVCSIL